MDAATDPWWESELAGCVFADARLGQRLHKLIERMGGATLLHGSGRNPVESSTCGD